MKKLAIILTSILLMPLTIMAEADPKAIYINENGDTVTATEITDKDAPLRVMFRANPSADMINSDATYIWYFTVSGTTTPYLTRYEQDTEFTFTTAGSTDVSLFVAYGDSEPVQEGETIKISIRSSMLIMPNTFTPNGDGVNDIYKVKQSQSLTEFRAIIFNRWGHKIYEWTDSKGGWDGNIGGKPAKAGVYFCYARAKGADGMVYETRTDVNLLRDFNQAEGTVTPTP